MSKYKKFKVVGISSNRNSFGLYGVILIAQDGDAWEVAASQHCIPRRGSVVTVPVEDSVLLWSELGYEIPTALPVAPVPVIREAWKLEVA